MPKSFDPALAAAPQHGGRRGVEAGDRDRRFGRLDKAEQELVDSGQRGFRGTVGINADEQVFGVETEKDLADDSLRDAGHRAAFAAGFVASRVEPFEVRAAPVEVDRQQAARLRVQRAVVSLGDRPGQSRRRPHP